MLCLILLLIFPNLEKEQRPSFLEPTDFYVVENLDGKYYVDTTISHGNYYITKRNCNFFLSSIEIRSSCEFSNNFAFGNGYASGYGGAIFISHCTFLCDGNDVIFKTNCASFGGAICSIKSGMYFETCPTFHDNKAFRNGGAIYFYGALVWQEDHMELTYYTGAILNIKNNLNSGSFRYNLAAELGGAIAFSKSAPCGIENCKFENNHAGLSGGAIHSINCPLSLIGCSFTNNNAGEIDMRVENADKHFLPPNRPNIIGRGGGAIYFYADKYMNGYNNPYDYEPSDDQFTRNDLDPSLTRQLYTDTCCFSGNKAYNAYSFGNGPGHEILLVDHVTWSSFNDYIQGYERVDGLVSSISNPLPTDDRFIDNPIIKDKRHVCLINIYNLNKDNTGICKSDSYVEQRITENSYSSISRYFAIDSSITFIPHPTSFTYQASPITKLPYKTTRTMSFYTPIFITPPTARTVAKTFKRTPVITPDSSPFITPYKTPLSSPYITPYKTPLSSPFITPYNTPYKTPFISPYKTPFNTPFSTPFITPFATPFLTPIPTISRYVFNPPYYDPNQPTTYSLFPSWTESLTKTLTLSSSYDQNEGWILVPTTTDYYIYVTTQVSVTINTYPSDLYTETAIRTQINTSTITSTQIYVDYTVIESVSDSTTIMITLMNTHIIFSTVYYYLTDTEIFTFLLFEDLLLEDQNSGGLSPTTIIIISVICGIVVFVVLGLFIHIIRKRNQKDDFDDDSQDENNLFFKIDDESGQKTIIYDDHENLDDPITIFSFQQHSEDSSSSDNFNPIENQLYF